MNTRCGAIILAAGLSRRMGSNKLLAEFGGKPLVAHVADAVEAAGLPSPIVVVGHEAAYVRAALANRRAAFVTAADHIEGMSRSLAAGLAAVPAAWEAAIICLGDMPLVSSALLRRLAEQASRSAIIVPAFNGKRGNPVLWGRDYFGDLASLQGDMGARTLFERYSDRIKFEPWHDDSIRRDVDSPAALDELRKR